MNPYEEEIQKTFEKTCEEGDYNQFLITFLFNKNFINKSSLNEGLRKACKNGHLLIVKELLKYKQPSWVHLVTKHIEIVKELLDYNIHNYESCLHDLCRLGYNDIVKEIFRRRYIFIELKELLLLLSFEIGNNELTEEILKDPRINISRVFKDHKIQHEIIRPKNNVEIFYSKEIKNYLSKKYLLYFNEEIEYLIND